MLSRYQLPTGHRALVQVKSENDGRHRTTTGQQGQDQHHHPSRIPQAKQGSTLPFTKGALALGTLETPLFLRVNPYLGPFLTVGTHHQGWIHGGFCHKIYSHESLFLSQVWFFFGTKIITFLCEALTISTRYFAVLPLTPEAVVFLQLH